MKNITTGVGGESGQFKTKVGPVWFSLNPSVKFYREAQKLNFGKTEDTY